MVKRRPPSSKTLTGKTAAAHPPVLLSEDGGMGCAQLMVLLQGARELRLFGGYVLFGVRGGTGEKVCQEDNNLI